MQLETKFARGKMMAYDEMPQIWQKEMQGQKVKLIQTKETCGLTIVTTTHNITHQRAAVCASHR